VLKSFNKNTVESSVLYLFALISFLVFQNLISSLILLALGALVSVYFFPLTLVLDIASRRKVQLTDFLSNLLICWIIVFTPIRFILKDSVFVDYFIGFLVFANLCSIVLYYVNSSNKRALLHFAASWVVTLLVVFK
jgi:hypothetical protein